MKKIRFMFFALFLFPAVLAQADEAGDKLGELPFVPGIIFNTSNLLMDIDSYQGGFGGKLLFPDYALRLMVNLGYHTTPTDRIELASGVVFEKQIFMNGRVNPYAGVLTEIGFSYDRWEADSDNWTRLKTLTAGVGGILGVEVFILDYLSVFAEYELSARLGWTAKSQNLGGIASDSSKLNYEVVTGLGNRSFIGVVVYLNNTGAISREEGTK